MQTEWNGLSAAELGRGIESGEIDPRDLTRYFLDAIDTHPDTDRIFARTTPDRATAEAAAAAQRALSGMRRGPLDGVPVSWKDLFDTAGTATEAGSALLRGRVPDRDATVLSNATSAGLVCLGKTHMSELAFSGLGLNPVTASPPNIHDPDRPSGGSSSGAAASVAHGLASAAIGSDTGGSVRIPAAWNDLVGLKTTHGLLSNEGVVPLCRSFDTVGPLCRSVEDAALLLDALSGARGQMADRPTPDSLRLLVPASPVLSEVDAGPARAFEAVAASLTGKGVTIETVEIPEIAEATELGPCLFAREAYEEWKQEIEAAPQSMYPAVLRRFRQGAGFNALQYDYAWKRMTSLRKTFLDRISGYDAVFLPTVPILPPSAKELLADEDYFTASNLMALRNTRVSNLFGLCAVTLPAGVPSCGISLSSAPLSERRLLSVAATVEGAF